MKFGVFSGESLCAKKQANYLAKCDPYIKCVSQALVKILAPMDDLTVKI